MISTLTTRPSVSEWQQEIEMAFNAMGHYRLADYNSELLRGINQLVDMLHKYEGVTAFRMDRQQCPDEFELGIKVNSQKAGFPFKAYVRYEVSADNHLCAVIHFTERASTEEFPIAGDGVAWKTEIISQQGENSPGHVLAWVKNYIIQYVSFQVIGRDIIYSVLEE
jgi:hypothetical protein